MTRRQLLAAAVRGAALATVGSAGVHVLSGCAGRVGRKPPRHVFLVTVDTLRADHLASYGYRRRRISPHIDRLAREGVLFEQPVAQASWTKASFASILTGLYPGRHGAIDRAHFLNRDAVTLTQRLASAGFTTIGVISNGWVGEHFGFAKGFRTFEETFRPDRPLYLTRAEDVNRHLWPLLDRAQGDRLFVWLLYIDPHDPYDAPAPWGGRYKQPGFPAGWPQHPPSPKRQGALVTTDEGGERIDVPAPIGEVINYYDGEVAYTDHHIGELMRGLARRGLDDDALIIFTSDHGEEFLEHGGQYHGFTLFEEQVHVPLIFRYPSSLVPSGTRLSGPVRLVDIVPTVLEAVGLAPHPCDGASLLGLMRERRPESRVAFSRETLHKDQRGGGFVDLRSLRRGDHKLIHIVQRLKIWNRPDAADLFRLYDLAQDPYERRDLGQDEAASEAKADLRALLEQYSAADLTPAEPGGEVGELPAHVRDNLRGLGYVE